LAPTDVIEAATEAVVLRARLFVPALCAAELFVAALFVVALFLAGDLPELFLAVTLAAPLFVDEVFLTGRALCALSPLPDSPTGSLLVTASFPPPLSSAMPSVPAVGR
jgi:hypothetical protein